MTPQDVTGWAVGALLLGSVLLLKVWHEEHLPALAGACTPAVALMAALSRLAARRPQLYAAHREAFVSLGALAISLATHALRECRLPLWPACMPPGRMRSCVHPAPPCATAAPPPTALMSCPPLRLYLQ